MTIRHLKIFIAVAECGSMRKASEVLFISQPSISQAISELEKHYNIKLFERLSKRLYITEDGKLLLNYARHIVNEFDNLENVMLGRNKCKRLRIGASVSVGTCLINDIIRKLKNRISNLDIYVNINNTSKIEEMILKNELDVGIVEGVIESRDIVRLPICEDELVVVAGKDHILSNKDMISANMLKDQDFISREDGSNDRNQFEHFLSSKNIEVNRKWICTNTEAIKNAVIEGNGLAILSKMVIEKEVKEGKIKIINVEDVKITRQIKLIYHKNKYLTDEINELIKIEVT